MGLFTKKEEVPLIPKAPTLPELPKPTEEVIPKNMPEAPALPTNPQNKNLNQEMVKSAVTDMPSPGENEVSVEIPKGVQVEEATKGEPSIPLMPSIEQHPTIPSTLPPIPTLSEKIEPHTLTPLPQNPSLTEPIFVRIDKFQDSQKNMENIKQKIQKIESVLKKIEDVRIKEEAELKGWSEDINNIKSRLAEVDTDIFDQI